MAKLKDREKAELYHIKEKNLDYFLDQKPQGRNYYRYEERCKMSFELRKLIEELMEKHQLSARRTYRLLGIAPDTFKNLMLFNPESNDEDINMPPLIGVLEKVFLVIRELND